MIRIHDETEVFGFGMNESQGIVRFTASMLMLYLYHWQMCYSMA